VGVTYSCASRVCRFDAGASAPTGGVTSYAWTFGDGVKGTGRTWTHTYGTAASYTFRVDIVTGTGKKYSAGKAIAPASASGSASSTVPTYVPPTGGSSGTITPSFSVICSGSRCAFNASKSKASKGISSYKWAFGDGYTGSTAAWTHTYSGKKTVNVTLTIVDKSAGSKSLTKSVAVP
jgi:hypothetical protein